MSQPLDKDPKAPVAPPAGGTPRAGKARETDPGSSDENDTTKAGRGLDDLDERSSSS